MFFFSEDLLFFIFKQIKSCDRCQRSNKIKTQAAELKAIKTTEPLELVGMEFIGKIPWTVSLLEIDQSVAFSTFLSLSFEFVLILLETLYIYHYLKPLDTSNNSNVQGPHFVYHTFYIK